MYVSLSLCVSKLLNQTCTLYVIDYSEFNVTLSYLIILSRYYVSIPNICQLFQRTAWLEELLWFHLKIHDIIPIIITNIFLYDSKYPPNKIYGVPKYEAIISRNLDWLLQEFLIFCKKNIVQCHFDFPPVNKPTPTSFLALFIICNNILSYIFI